MMTMIMLMAILVKTMMIPHDDEVDNDDADNDDDDDQADQADDDEEGEMVYWVQHGTSWRRDHRITLNLHFLELQIAPSSSSSS